VQDPGVRIEVIGPEQAHVRTTVQRQLRPRLRPRRITVGGRPRKEVR
jgi:hypothetical protein